MPMGYFPRSNGITSLPFSIMFFARASLSILFSRLTVSLFRLMVSLSASYVTFSMIFDKNPSPSVFFRFFFDLSFLKLYFSLSAPKIALALVLCAIFI